MLFIDPHLDGLPEFRGKLDQFAGLLGANTASGVVFSGVSFTATGIEVVGVVLPF